MNRFARRVDVGFEASTSALDAIRSGYQDLGRSSIFKVRFADLDPRIAPFLWNLGLSVFHTEVFYTSPGRFTQIHLDGSYLNNFCKLNWVYGAAGSKMIWYDDRPGSPGPSTKKTAIGTPYKAYETDDCLPIFEAEIGTPSLVNAGWPHNVHNCTNEGRWCVSLVLKHAGTKDGLVEWNDGERMLAGHIVD